MSESCMVLIPHSIGSSQCGRPAKYKTTIDKTGKDLYLCGLHARVMNGQYENQGSDKRCEGYFE